MRMIIIHRFWVFALHLILDFITFVLHSCYIRVTFVLQMCYRFWHFVCVSLPLSFLSISSFYSQPLFSFSFHFSPFRYYGTFYQYCFLIFFSFFIIGSETPPFKDSWSFKQLRSLKIFGDTSLYIKTYSPTLIKIKIRCINTKRKP